MVGYIAVAELWAEYISRDFNGLGRENSIFWAGPNYIPLGLYNDLEDNNTFIPEIINGFPDLISGFTRQQMFNALTCDVNSV